MKSVFGLSDGSDPTRAVRAVRAGPHRLSPAATSTYQAGPATTLITVITDHCPHSHIIVIIVIIMISVMDKRAKLSSAYYFILRGVEC